MREALWDLLVREWLLAASALALLLTSIHLGHAPLYTWRDTTPILLLFALFVVIKGLERSRLPLLLARRLERGSHLAPRLVLLTFFLSMVVTIDVTLVTMLPLVLAMRTDRRVELAILVALTAHVGAALTPFGTPQNLFIYRWYEVELWEFLRVMLPFVGGLLLLLLTASLFVRTEPVGGGGKRVRVDRTSAWGYLLLFGLVAAAVVGLVPGGAAIFAVLYALLFDRRALRVDYALLLTFFIFVGVTANLREMVEGALAHRSHTFLLATVMSQFLSNVPTTLLLERFTDHWRALLWGVNVGGFGSLVAALANLITYKLFVTHGPRNGLGRFVLLFVVAGYVTLLAGVALHTLFFDYIHRYGG